MRKNLRMVWLALFAVVCTAWHAEAQLLTEDFNFSGTLVANGWTAHDAAGTNAISTTTGLTYPGLTSVGNAAALTTSGEDAHRTFTSQSSGSVYTSFLVNVSAAQSSGNYFFHLGGNPIGTTFFNRLFVKSATGGFQFGLSFNSSIPATPTYDPTVYNFGQTYLIVVKYTFVSGTGNDVITFYVNPSAGGSEPGSGAITAITTTSDAASIASVALRQSTASTAPTLVVDRIRVGTAWNDVVGGTPTPSLSVAPATLSGMTYVEGSGPSNAGSFTLSGSSLDPASGFVSATAPPNFQFSLDNTTFSGTVSVPYNSSSLSTTLYAKLVSGLTASTYGGTGNFAGGSASTTISVSGTVTSVGGCPTSGVMSIACARQIALGLAVGNVNSTQDVTVTGTVSVSSQFGGTTFYLQDGTGGIAVYGGSGVPGLSRSIGETITVTGKVTYFYGVVEISSPVITSPTAGSAPTAASIAVTAMGAAASQGKLVSISGATISDMRDVFQNKENYNFSTSGGSGQLRMQPDIQDLINSVIPKTPLTLTGILDAYDPDDNPGTTGDIVYQISPRFNADVPGVTEYTPGGGATPRTATLDLASFNLEWLGSTGLGPVNSGAGDVNQIANAVIALKYLDADLYTIPEVVLETALQSIVDGLSAPAGLNTAFTKVCPASDCGSYGGSGNQKVCFIYKNSVFANVTTTCMNESFGQSSNAWASGRFPFMLSANVTVNGTTRAMRFIGIHAKAIDDQDSYLRRKTAADALAGWINTNYPNDKVVLMGDYNDDLDVSITRNVANTGYEPTPYTAFTTAPTLYSPITLALSQKGFSSTLGFDNVIDHMIVTNEVIPALVANSPYAISPDVVTTTTGNWDWLHTLSDHVPIIVRFDISQIVDCSTTAGITPTSPVSVCRNSSLTLTASGGNNYSWAGPGVFTTSAATLTISNALNPNEGIYTVTVNKTGCTNIATASISVIVKAKPSVDATSNSPVCRGTTIQLSAAAGNTNYSWVGPDAVSFTSTSSSPSWTRTNATNAMQGVYSVTVTAVNSCTNSGTVAVNVQGLPNPTASNNASTVNTAICEGSAISLSVSEGVSFTWASPDNVTFTSTVQSPSWTRTNATVAMEGTYTVTAANNNGCTASATTRVRIRPAPVATSSANTPCAGQSLQLSASGGASYKWAAPSGTTFNSTASAPSWTRTNSNSSMAGVYTVTVTGSNSCTASSTVNVTINPLPTPTISSNSPVCTGGTIRLSAGGGISYTWGGPPVGNPFTSNAATPTIDEATNAKSGKYSVTVSNGSCTASASTSVVVTSSITISLSVSANPVCEGTTLNMTASGAEAYSWSTSPSGFTSTSATPTIPSVSIVSIANMQLSNNGIYLVKGQSHTCIATANVYISTKKCATCSVAITATTAATSACVGGNVQLSSTVTGSTGGLFYWKGPNGYVSNVKNPIAPIAVVGANVFTILYTDSVLLPNNPVYCTASATVSVNGVNCGSRISAAENANNDAGITLTASPNPTDGRVTIEVRLQKPSMVTLQMTDLLGRSIEQWTSGEEQDYHTFDVSLERYQAGVYVMTAEADKQRATKKIIKTNR